MLLAVFALVGELLLPLAEAFFDADLVVDLEVDFAVDLDAALFLAEALFAPEALVAALVPLLVEAFFFFLESSDVVFFVREGFFEDVAIMGEIIQKMGNVVKGGGFGS